MAQVPKNAKRAEVAAVSGITGPDRFEKTSWGDFAQLQKSETRQHAQERIVRRYHRPLVAYQMYKGSKKYDAEDMVQSFFAHAFEKWLFESVDAQAKGLFRNWLLTCYKRFVRDQQQKRSEQFNRVMVSDIADNDDGGRHRFEAVDLSSPDGAFDAAWARELLCEAQLKLEKDTLEKWHYDLFVEKNSASKSATWTEIAAKIGKPELNKDRLEHVYASMKARAEKILRDLLSVELEDGRKPAQDEEVRHILRLCQSKPLDSHSPECSDGTAAQ